MVSRASVIVTELDFEGVAIAVNDQWRICFRFVDGDAFEVEFCDYH